MSLADVVIEVIALSARDALDAEAGGADRIELVSDMAQGGLTPAPELVRDVVRQCRLPVMVMLRPHARSFVYDEADMHHVHAALSLARDAGAQGVVFGALTPEGDIDRRRLEQVIRWADGLPLTFHRAFDAARDPAQAFGVLGDYRGAIAQVLTSGAAPTAMQGAELLAQFVQRCKRGEGVEPLLGAGIDADNITALHGRVGAHQYHVGSGARIGGRFDAGVHAGRVAALRGLA